MNKRKKVAWRKHRVKAKKADEKAHGGRSAAQLGEQRKAAIDDHRLAANHLGGVGAQERNTCAMSSGSTMRPPGVRALLCAITSGPQQNLEGIGLEPAPDTAFTRTPNGANSTAR
jgi:hypothetical protein